ncbi:MAG: AAA family ATPase, partial [Candidatus Thorarchaeota archaeon]
MVKSPEYLREQVWSAIRTIESHGLFVHSEYLQIRAGHEDAGRAKVYRLPLITGACVINALVPRSAVLLVGGHGGGKTTLVKLLGRMLTGCSIEEIEDGMLRGHPQLTEEKMVATLRPGPLMREGKEIIVWRKFVTGFWKIIDEVNRLTPHAQNILLSLLAEGELKYYDEVKRCNEYCLYATMNPTDPGAFELSPPFLDRFGMAVPITMPTFGDLGTILAVKDDRLFGYDEVWQVPSILSQEDLLTIWNLADKTPVSERASEFMRAIVREFDICVRIDKSQVRDISVNTGLCDGCHYDVEKSICNKVVVPISVRAAKDLNRYCKAASWLVGADEVTVDIVKSIAPLVLWHRTEFSRDDLFRSPYFGNRYRFTEHLVELAATKFAQRETVSAIMERFRMGNGSKRDYEVLQDAARSDLLVRHDWLPSAKDMARRKYTAIVKETESSIKKGNIDQLETIWQKLNQEQNIPNRAALLERVSRELCRL